jgi:uncharacterized protein YjbI with pentapeptide repeats
MSGATATEDRRTRGGGKGRPAPDAAPAPAPETVDSVTAKGLNEIKSIDANLAREVGAGMALAGFSGVEQTKGVLNAFKEIAGGLKAFTSIVDQASRSGFLTRSQFEDLVEKVSEIKKNVVGNIGHVGSYLTASGADVSKLMQSLDRLEAATNAKSEKFFKDVPADPTRSIAEVVSTKTRIEREVETSEQFATKHSSLEPLLADELEHAPISLGKVGATELTASKRDGFIYLKGTIDNGAGVAPTEVEFKLDHTSVISAGKSPAEVQATHARVQGMLVTAEEAWKALTADPAKAASNAAELQRGTGYGFVSSEFSKSLRALGAQISLLKNGAFTNETLSGLALPKVTLENFHIVDCYAHGLSMPGATIINSRLHNNDMHGGDLSGSDFQGDCEFTKNDMHGAGSSVAACKFGTTNCRGCNFIETDMSGIQADSLENPRAKRTGIVSKFWDLGPRYAFRNQFGGCWLSSSQLTDPEAKAIFNNNMKLETRAPKLEALAGSPISTDLIDMFKSNPMIRVDKGVDVPADPKRGILRPSTMFTISSLDGENSTQVMVENRTRLGYIQKDDGTWQLVSNAEVLEHALRVARQNRRQWTGAEIRNGNSLLKQNISIVDRNDDTKHEDPLAP